jgi:hypothetical protein
MLSLPHGNGIILTDLPIGEFHDSTRPFASRKLVGYYCSFKMFFIGKEVARGFHFEVYRITSY